MNADVERELEQAIEPSSRESTRKIVFAAAGNTGGNMPRGWLANRDNVIAVHASSGLGSAASFNPHPEIGHNFSTLGQDIKICHKPSANKEEDRHVYVSGTSFATPIAAGIAANVLEFARNELPLTYSQKERLYSSVCMAKIFHTMSSDSGGGYRYVQPWTFWWPGRLKHDIAMALKKIIEGC